MELETVRNATTRELDWDNALAVNMGSCATTNTTTGQKTIVDVNGDRHTLKEGGSFDVKWTIPENGVLIPASVTNYYLHSSDGVPKKLSEVASKLSLNSNFQLLNNAVSGTVIAYQLYTKEGTIKHTFTSKKFMLRL